VKQIVLFIFSEVRVIVPIFIDDITLAGTSNSAIDKVVEDLKSHFKIRDLGLTQFLLGIHITHDLPNHTISLSQRQYIINVLEHFGMSDCKPVLKPPLSLTSDMCPKSEEDVAEMFFIWLLLGL
jgi:hypothetical protein